VLSLHLCLLLVLGLSINTSIASESLENLSPVGSHEKSLIEKKKDSRQRGECGTPPNVWTLNICQSNKFCYAAPDKVSLWLEKRPKGTVRVLVNNLDTSDFIEFSWKTSDATLDWPEKLVPISSGATYNIEIWKRKFRFEKEISLHQIPVELETITEKAEWMKKNGCKSQAEILLTEIKSSF